MKYIDNQGIMDPRINLAIEEYALYNLDINETYLLFYSMDPSVIVGKNQNTIEEINVGYVEKNNVYVVRRLSGGGAVYNDRGDLSFSFITKHDKNSFHNYAKFTGPIIKALHKLGVNAELSGRNDILVQDKKVSGNAQFSTRGRMFSHGTLMFDVNLDNLEAALRVDKEKIASKGVKSVRSRVGNIRDYLNKDMTIDGFKRTLLQFIFEGESEIAEYRLTERDWQEIYAIADKRYKNCHWNYGKSPSFNVKHRHRFSAGTVDVRLYVVGGKIETAKIYGDFFGVGDVKDIEDKLIGVRYTTDDIRAALDGVDFHDYFGDIPGDELLALISP